MSDLTDYESTTMMSDVKSKTLPDGRMDRANAARYLGYKPQTLAKWAMQGKGPRYVRVGGRIFYFLHDLNTFIQEGAQR